MLLLLLICMGAVLVLVFTFLSRPVGTAVTIIQIFVGFLALASFFGLFMTEFESSVALGYTTFFGILWLLLTVFRWKATVGRKKIVIHK